MSWGIVAAVGTTVVGGALGAKGAKDAQESHQAGVQQGIDAELQMFREGQEATAPWRATGVKALGALEDIYGLDAYSPQISTINKIKSLGAAPFGGGESQAQERDPYASFFGMQDRLREGFQESPGQAYQLAEAEKAAKRSLSAKGFSGSGAEMKELQRVAQGQASQEWGNYLGQFGDYTNALRSMAGQGQTSAGQTAAQSAQVGSNIASDYQSMGAAAAQKDISQANIYGNVLQQGAQAYGMYQGMNQPQASTTPQPMAGSPYGMQPGYTYA